MLAPVVPGMVVSEPIQFVAGVLPTYWPINALVACAAGEPRRLLYLLAGLGYHLLALFALVRWFEKRAD